MRVLDIELFRLLPELEVASLSPVLEACADLGAEFLLVTGNDTDEQRACDNYAALCDLAAPLRLRPMLEFIPYRPLRDIHQAERWLRRVEHPAAGMCMDALHLFRSGGTLDDLRRVDPRHIGYASYAMRHPCCRHSIFPSRSWCANSRANRRLPGEGVLPLAGFLVALPPDLAISVEAPCGDLRAALRAGTRRARDADHAQRAGRVVSQLNRRRENGLISSSCGFPRRMFATIRPVTGPPVNPLLGKLATK